MWHNEEYPSRRDAKRLRRAAKRPKRSHTSGHDYARGAGPSRYHRSAVGTEAHRRTLGVAIVEESEDLPDVA